MQCTLKRSARLASIYDNQRHAYLPISNLVIFMYGGIGCSTVFRKMWLLRLHLLWRIILAVESGFNRTPSNTAVVVGRSMRMECWINPNKTVQWSYSPPDKKMLTLVYNGDQMSKNFTPRFNIDNSTVVGQNDLTTKNVVMMDAGIYACTVLTPIHDRTTDVQTTAELIVLESEPLCSMNRSTTDGDIAEFDYVEFQCSLNLSGQYPPFMQWSKRGKVLNQTAILSYSNIFHNVKRFSSITVWQVTSDDNDALITCKTSFNEAIRQVYYTNATNVPSYLHYWNFTLDVHFGTRNVTIVPQNDAYRKEDVLNCTAQGNPRPSYTWRLANTDAVISTESRLALSEANLISIQQHTIVCTAQNYVLGKFKLSTAQIVVTIPGTGLTYVTILMGILCAILLLTVVVAGRGQIKGWLTSLHPISRRDSTIEPDILPNTQGYQIGNSSRQRPESDCGSSATEEDTGATGLNQRIRPDVPIYAEVNKTTGTYGHRVDSPAGTSNEPASKIMNIGLDGTVYAELKADDSPYQPQASRSLFQNPMFNKSEYASIDHTAV